MFTSSVVLEGSSQEKRRGRDRQSPALGSPSARYRSDSRRLPDRRRPVNTVARKRDQRHVYDDQGDVYDGDAIRVFCRSVAAWMDGEIVKVFEDNFVRVEYEVDECWHGKILQLHSEHLAIPSAATSSPDQEHDSGFCASVGLPDVDSRGNKSAAAPGTSRLAALLREHVAELQSIATEHSTIECSQEEIEEHDPGAFWIEEQDEEDRYWANVEMARQNVEKMRLQNEAARSECVRMCPNASNVSKPPCGMCRMCLQDEAAMEYKLNLRWNETEHLGEFAGLLHAEEVHVISSPNKTTNPNAAAKCRRLKHELMAKSPNVIVFDPNTDMERMANQRFWSTEEQHQKWLQIWALFALIARDMVREKGPGKGQIHVMCKRAPRTKNVSIGGITRHWGWRSACLDGTAQQGELLIAVMGGFESSETGLHFYECGETPVPQAPPKFTPSPQASTCGSLYSY